MIAASDILSGRMYKGDSVENLERMVSERIGVRHALCVPQGRVGLYLAVKSLIKPGQKVIMSPYTIYDVVNMVIAAGGRPVFADIERQTCNIDPLEVEKLIDREVGAVLVTHLHGLAAEMAPILEVCRAYGVPVIEDVAQAFGGSYDGHQLGSLGAVSMLSFGRVKNVNGFFGGMVLTDDDALLASMKEERSRFPQESSKKLLTRIAHCLVTDIIMSPPVFWGFSYWLFRYGCMNDVQSINKLVETEDNPVRRDVLPEHYRARMTPMQARVVAAQLPDLDGNSRARIDMAERYAQALDGQNEVVLPPRRTDGSHIYLAYPVQVEDRMDLVKHLMRHGNDVVIQHIGNTSDFECFREFHRECKVARQVARETVLLPTYPGFRTSEMERIAESVRDWNKLRLSK